MGLVEGAQRRVVVPLLDRVAAEGEEVGRVLGNEPAQHEPIRPQHRRPCGGQADPARDVLRGRRVEVREDGVPSQDTFAGEARLLQHPRRRPVLEVAQRVQSSDAQLGGERGHCGGHLRRVAMAPGVAGEHVTGRGPVRRLDLQPGGADDHALSVDDHVRPRGRRPRCVAELQEAVRVGDGGVSRPSQQARDLGVARVAEDRLRVGGHGAAQHETGGGDRLRRPHRPRLVPEIADSPFSVWATRASGAFQRMHTSFVVSDVGSSR